MSLPKYIETNWCSKGKSVLSFTFNGKNIEENDTVVYLSTLYIKEFEKESKQPCEVDDTNNLNAACNDTHFTDQEYLCPPGISSELWQDWLVHWENWKEIYIPLAWVENYRSVCTPEYVSWHDDYLNDFPGVRPCIQEGLDIENKTQNPDFENSKNGAFADNKKDTMAEKGIKEDWEMIHSEEAEEKYIHEDKIVNSSNKDGQELSGKVELDMEYDSFSKLRFWIHLWIFLNSAGIEKNEELSEYFMSNAKYEIKNTGPIIDIYNNDTEELNIHLENSEAIKNSVVEVNDCQFENLSKKDEENYNSSNNFENNDKEKLDGHMAEIISKDIDCGTLENNSIDLEINLIDSTKKFEDLFNDDGNGDCETNIQTFIESKNENRKTAADESKNENQRTVAGESKNEIEKSADDESINENKKAADDESKSKKEKTAVDESKNENADKDDLKDNENNLNTLIEDKLSPRGQKRHIEENLNEDGEFLGKIVVDIKSDSKKSKKNQLNQRLSSGLSWAMKYIVKESNETVCPFKVSDISQDEQRTSKQSKNTIPEDIAESTNIFSAVRDINIESSSSIITHKSSNKVEENDFSEDKDFNKTDNAVENNKSNGEDHQKTKKKGKKSKNKTKKTDCAVEKVQPWWWFRMGRSVHTLFHWCTSHIFKIIVSSIESIVSVIFPAWLQRAIAFGSAWKAVEKPTAVLNKWLKASTNKPSSANTIIMLPKLYLNYVSHEIDERMPQTVYQSVDVENDKVYITTLQLDQYEECLEEDDEESWTRTHVVFDEDGNPQTVSTMHSSNNYEDERTVINKASDTWKEMLKGHQLVEYSIANNAPAHLPKQLQKYWAQRYRLFLKFDQGIQMDEESWYSVTPEMIAAHHAYRCSCDVVVDAFCGSGGNAIQLAYTCNQVIAVDVDPNKIKLARHNAEVYGVAHRIQFIVGDFFKLAPSLKANVVYLSPPWGGIEYLHENIYNVSALGGCMDARKLIDAARTITSNIALYLPRTSDLYQVIELAGAGGSVDIESNMMGRKKKAITAYYGELVNIDHCG